MLFVSALQTYWLLVIAYNKGVRLARRDMMNIEHDPIHSSMLINKGIVYEYFRLIKQQDIDRLLSLFTNDAIVHEPFSNIARGLQGKAAIRPFLKIAIMANSGLAHSIAIEKAYNNNIDKISIGNKERHNDNNSNKVTALVKFQRGDSVKARFTFKLAPVLTESTESTISLKKKIQRLDIGFIT